MTKTEQNLNTLPEDISEKISSLFGDTSRLYAVCYLISQNEHYYTMDKPTDWEPKLAAVHSIQQKLETILDRWGVSGADILADVKSDYLDDFLAYSIRTFNITEEQFLATIKAIQDYSV